MSIPTKRGFGETMIAVAWSFIGLRRKRDFDKDVEALNPLYVIGAGLIGVAVLVATLISIVRMVVSA
ncbi:DUF2970 domain-containing protein [Pseudoduganella violacea]|uniref:DUF2970 domain-containing protein n=1 Tax=Pseudoduganella violacea TaxID=1715466 RepID=A0A7W5FWP5_9BURK|nr:DUF2970 domain-containing protein [Pseudoduganella violacea]MBB3122032.1 hypothetical protein [Pseudoduganella violacea]